MKELKVKPTINAYDMLPEILGSTFYYWSWWEQVKYDEGYDWNTYPDDPKKKFLRLKIENPAFPEGSGKFISKKLSVLDIVEAFFKSKAMSWDNLDAGSSDYIMQFAMLGEYTYA